MRATVGRDADQVIRNDPEPDPSMHAVEAVITTPNQSMTSFQHTNATLGADTPPLATTEPGLAFVGPPRRRFWATPRQNDSTDSTIARDLLVGRRAEAPIRRRQIRGAPKDGVMLVEC